MESFDNYGYETLAVLSNHQEGGRVTYLARSLETDKKVVIKQFRWIRSKTWSGYKQIQSEISVLKSLSHPYIPRYLEEIDAPSGLCLVQEYIEAEPLSARVSYSLEEIKVIARKLLDILVYLQSRLPPVVHRDIKPENVLIDKENRVYLVDFGLARSSDRTLALSSMMGGTFGFMSPEQIAGQKLTPASDLYGVGATLVCLLCGLPSGKLGDLFNFEFNRLDFRDRLPQVHSTFLDWLERLTAPNPSRRYLNAKDALAGLQGLPIVHREKIEPLNQSKKLGTNTGEDSSAISYLDFFPIKTIAASTTLSALFWDYYSNYWDYIQQVEGYFIYPLVLIPLSFYAFGLFQIPSFVDLADRSYPKQFIIYIATVSFAVTLFSNIAISLISSLNVSYTQYYLFIPLLVSGIVSIFVALASDYAEQITQKHTIYFVLGSIIGGVFGVFR